MSTRERVDSAVIKRHKRAAAGAAKVAEAALGANDRQKPKPKQYPSLAALYRTRGR